MNWTSGRDFCKNDFEKEQAAIKVKSAVCMWGGEAARFSTGFLFIENVGSPCTTIEQEGFRAKNKTGFFSK